ncbi:MAG: T9SS type A sorting domain-containing protein [Bacteroidota bacterium]
MKTLLLSIIVLIVLIPEIHAQYAVTSIPYSPYSYGTGTPLLVNIDDTWSGVINLPFTFYFYGNAYTQLVIGSNGLITFNTTLANTHCPWSYSASCPDPTIVESQTGPFIFGPYHDIDPSITGDIYYSTYDSYPNRKFVISFNTIAMFYSSCNSLLATHQIVLYEGSNYIDVNIQNKPLCSTWNEGNAVIGIQNSNGTLGISPPGRNTGAWTATNEAWRFGTTIFPDMNLTVCSDSAVLDATPYFETYLWSTGDTIQSINVFSSGIYYISATTYNGDTISDSINLLLTHPYLNLNLGNDTLICGNDTITIDAGIGFSQYQWNTGSANQSIVVDQTGIYSIVVTDTANCSYEDTVQLIINPSQSLDLGNDTALCDYGTFTFDAGIAFDSYQWSTGETTQSISVDSSGTYYITATNIQCSVTVFDSVSIIFHAVPVADAGVNDTICTGASGTLSASGGLSYHWSTGSNSQNINVSPTVTTTYTVTVTNANGCMATDFASIVVLPALNAVISHTNTTCGLSNGSASVTVTGGSGFYAYQWSTTPPQNTPTAVNLSSGSYAVTVTDLTCGNTTINSVYISNIPAPSVSIQNIINANCNENNGDISITLTGGTAPYNYQWNSTPPQSGQMLFNVPPGNYCVTVTDGNGCTATVCGTIQTVAYTAPDICMVSVDTAANQNLVIWEKPVTSGIDQYYIYRESSIGGIYNLIDTQNYSNLSTYSDITSNSLQQPYRYKIAIFDNCGLLSQQSNYHQTIHLTINAGMGGSWNLIWNNYEGFSFSTYNIYRGTNSGNMTLLNSVANTINSYTDLAPPSGVVYYMIEVVVPVSCNPSFKSEDSFGSTISNVANTNEVGISEFYDVENIQIYPNPGSGIFTILFSDQTCKSANIEILNSLGQLVYTEIMNTNTKNIDMSKLAKGIYSLKLTVAGKSYFKKIVVE